MMNASHISPGPAFAEGRVAVPGGDVWYRSAGDGGVPVLVLHGGPGLPHGYLTSHDALADTRRVVYYDQLGCGRSDQPDDPSLWTVERFVLEVQAVRDGLGLDEVHLLGHSWGGSLALACALDAPRGIRSVTVSSGPASWSRFGDDMLKLKHALPSEILEEMQHHEQHGWQACPEYQAAMMAFHQRHLCRLPRWPEPFHEAMANASGAVYAAMRGTHGWRPTGALEEWDVMDRLEDIEVPVMLLAGRYDMCTPEHIADMAARLPDARAAILENSSHLAFFEEPDQYLLSVSEFLEEVDAGAAGFAS